MIAAGLMFQVLLSLNTSMRLLFSSFGLVIILGLFAAAFPIAFILMEALGKSPDMTGRVPIWVALFVWAQERPWLGFGYSTGFKFEMVPRLTEYIGFAADHAHNGYLEIFIGLGYVGVAALVFVILSFLSRLMKSLTCNIENERVVIPFIGMIFFCALVTNISESSFFRKGELLGALWSLGYLMLSTYEKKDVLNGRVRNTRKLDVGA
jgi:exopolysaccharide production protein ExoQ